MRAGYVWLIVLAFAVVAQAGCDDSESDRSERRPSPADVVPRDATAYGEATILLRGPAGRAARRFLTSLLGLRDVRDDALLHAIGEIAGEEIDFELLEAWLGERAGFFVVESRGEPAASGGVVLESSDQRAARRFIRGTLGPGARAERHGGVRLWRASDDRAGAMVDGHVVVTSSVDVMRAAIEARGAPLSSTRRYRRARGARTPFAFVLVSAAGLKSGLDGLIRWSASERRDLERLVAPEGDVVIRASVSGQQVVARIRGLRRSGERADPIATFPDDAWFAASSSDLSSLFVSPLGRELGSGASLGKALSALVGARVPADFLAELRRGTVYVQGRPDVANGQILAEVASRHAIDRAILRFGRAVERAGSHRVEWISRDPGNPEFDANPRRGSPGNGFRIERIGSDLIFEFGAAGGGGELRDTPTYRAAKRTLGEAPTTLLDMRQLLGVGSPGGEAGPLGRLWFVAAVESGRGDALEFSLAIRLAPGRPREPTASRPGGEG